MLSLSGTGDTSSRSTRYLNLGILAHVDAGKTSLTERLLYNAGVITRIGSVDQGTTQTDTLALERQRGITIKSAVASFPIGDVTVNLIDTPGHPDFIAEVERVLTVLDGAVLVISSVEGVQAQTRILARALQRLHIPTVLFINKIDRAGARDDDLLRSIAERLTPDIIPMGQTIELGTREATFLPFQAADARFRSRLAEFLADRDDAVLTRYLEDEEMPFEELACNLARLTARAAVHPVFFGSAITGAGVDSLVDGIETLLPAVRGDGSGRTSGAVFKVDRGATGDKIAYVRLFSGTVRPRDRVIYGQGQEGKITALHAFDGAPARQSAQAVAGQIAKLWGLGEVRIGDAIGTEHGHEDARYFAPPTLETAVVPHRSEEKGALHLALSRLAEQDPLINLRQDDLRGELYLSLYGEVQKEVIQATLADDFNLDVEFRGTTTLCIERVTGHGEALELLGKGGNPFLGTVGLRVTPAPPGHGIQLEIEAALESIPIYIYKSVEEFHRVTLETVRTVLRQGLYGWEVPDCRVTLTQCDYASPASTARDFRLLIPLVLMGALKEAGTTVCEPIHHFRLECPADTYGAVIPLLGRFDATLQSSSARGDTGIMEGTIPVARVTDLRRHVPGPARGEGVLETEFAGYRAMAEPFPTRPRTDLNPLDRKEYLLHVVRRV